jgi:hypothetical protein
MPHPQQLPQGRRTPQVIECVGQFVIPSAEQLEQGQVALVKASASVARGGH